MNDANQNLVIIPVLPPRFLNNGEDNVNYSRQLISHNYRYLHHYQNEHFTRMQLLKQGLLYPNLPPHIQVHTDIRVRDWYQPWHDLIPHDAVDPFFDSELSTNVTNHDQFISMDNERDFDDDFLRYMDCTTTAARLEDAIYDLTLAYRNGAPIDALGYPLTHGYNHGNYIAHDPVPAFTTINRDTPYDGVPPNLILQEFPTGPDIAIRKSNPLYHWAINNVPLPVAYLDDLPDIYTYNPDFLDTYDIRPNIIATLFRNGPHELHDTFKDEANYGAQPPNINGLFTPLHHNFYETAPVGLVHDADHILGNTDYLENVEWAQMTSPQKVEHIDHAFLACHTARESYDLWTDMLPSLLYYDFSFCSVCTCRLPVFYFSGSQQRKKRTERACVHCEANRKVKIELINRILGAAGYFTPMRRCVTCQEAKPKHCFTNGRWRHRTNRTCHLCT